MATWLTWTSLTLHAATSAPESPSADSSPGDFNLCAWFAGNPGNLYKNPENPWIQEITFNSRFHYNAALVDGSGTDGQGWSETYTDIRRFRFASRMRLLDFIILKASANLVDDERSNAGAAPALRTLNLGYYDFDEASLTLDLAKLFSIESIDKLELMYGRVIWHGGLEARTGSNEMLTVERSAVSNKLLDGARPTGVTIHAIKGDWGLITGVSSSGGRYPDPNYGQTWINLSNNEFLGGWNDALIYNFELHYTPRSDLRFGYEFIYNGGNQAENSLPGMDDNLLPYKWASAFSAEYQCTESAGISAELIYGDNGNIDQKQNLGRTERQGMFGGLIVMPYYWIVPKRLQAVVQYMWEASEEDQGVRSNSRYLRAADSGASNAGRGDMLQSFYGGLNWHLCDHNLKVQLGLQHEMLRTPNVGDGSVSATTVLLGFRTFF